MALSSLAIAVIGFLVWGHHMFVTGQSMYAGHGFLVAELSRGGSVRNQGVQLDGDDVQRVRLLRHADALRARVYRPVHDRRPDGLFLATMAIDVHVPIPISSSRISTT